ncbi:MAG: GNAT family N-acetyltransferase [Planctomycetota bacterium]
MRGFEIRDAMSSDRDAMVSVERAGQNEPARVAFIERSLRSATCLVAEREGRLIAYGVLEYWFFDNGFVSMVYVAEPERRQGVGRALLEELAERCVTPKLFTSTNESNRPMQQLLHLLGYVPSGVVENLDPDDPELFYFLDLDARRPTRRFG